MPSGERDAGRIGQRLAAIYQLAGDPAELPDYNKWDVVEAVRDAFASTYRVIDIDGARVYFDDGAWALVRASNTSPSFRCALRAHAGNRGGDESCMRAELAKHLASVKGYERLLAWRRIARSLSMQHDHHGPISRTRDDQTTLPGDVTTRVRGDREEDPGRLLALGTLEYHGPHLAIVTMPSKRGISSAPVYAPGRDGTTLYWGIGEDTKRIRPCYRAG